MKKIKRSYFLPYILKYEFENILDIGPGDFDNIIKIFIENNKQVYALDIKKQFLYEHENLHFLMGDFLTYKFNRKFDAILASHILEHIQDVGLFLNKVWDLLENNGTLFIIVPPYKKRIVGGHVSTGWNIGTLMYNLLLCGFDVRNGRFKKKGYNIIGIVKKRTTKDLPILKHDNGDIELLKKYFPNDDYFEPRFKGNIEEWNWFEEIVEENNNERP